MIKAQLGQTSLSERTITQKAERLSKKYKTEDEITEDVIKDAVDDLKDAEGQLNNELAKKAKELKDLNEAKISDLEKKLKELSDKKPSTPPDETPSWFKEFQARQETELAALKKRLDAENAANRLSTFKSELRKAMTDKGCDRPYFVDTVLNRIQEMKDGDTVEAIIPGMLTTYDREVTAALGEGISPRGGDSGDGKKVDSAMDEYFAQKAEEMGIKK